MLPLACALFCGGLGLLPELAARSATPPGEVWVPVNSQYKMIGDRYFYAAAVREARESFWRHHNPVTSENGGGVAVDRFRAFTYRCLVIAGLFWPDARYAYLISFIAFLVICFLTAYWLAREAGLDPWGACAVALVAMLWVKLGYVARTGSFSTIHGWRAQWDAVAFDGERDFDLFNDSFRYAIMGTAICVFWTFAAAMARFDKRPSRLVGAGCALLLVALVYTYFSVAMMGALFFAFLIARALAARRFQHVRALALVGVAALVVAIVVGLPWDLRAGTTSHSVAVAVHVAEVVTPTAGQLFRELYQTPYLALAALAVFLTHRRPDAFCITCAALSSALLLHFLQLVPALANPISRFLTRGFDYFWLFAVALGLAAPAFSEPSAATGWRRWTARALLAVVMVALVRPPAKAALTLARALRVSESRRIPMCQWDAYQFVRHHSPANAEVLAMDWEDAQLLPVYTDANLYFGDVSFSDRSPIEEATRYLRARVLLGLPLATLRTQLARYVADAERIGFARPSHVIDKRDTDGIMTMRHLFYDPYVTTFDGLPIRAGGRLNPAFLDRFFALAPVDLAPSDVSAVYILVSKDVDAQRATPRATPHGYETRFSTDCRTLYQKAP
jgi:hypothetical protein